MKPVKIKSYLRNAALEDLLEAGKLAENKELFYQSVHTQKLEGPYFLSTNKDWWEFAIECDLNMLLVLDPGNHFKNSFPFKLCLQKATANDLKINDKELKIRISYYVLSSKKNIQGPFYITENSKPKELAAHLKNEALYILSKNQTFELIETKQIA